MALGSVLLEILQRPTTGKLLSELLISVIPLWVAVAIGVLVGCQVVLFGLLMMVGFKRTLSLCHEPSILKCSSSKMEKEKSNLVMEDDLEHLCKLVEVKDGGPAWIQMMDRSTPTMNYQAWRRDPETGPPQYRSRTVFEDATPEMVRDFFWDDEFRAKWDDMLVHAETLEECPTRGTMVVQWVRKFPFFCSDREYIIGRRIWESGRLYYCVTKGVPCSSVPRRNKPRRVDFVLFKLVHSCS
ncbi:hypothetical protein OIU76_025783 [Salix suchowensis]|nr:hypothetical protein OIU76_025783 [Salix suchowensis]